MHTPIPKPQPRLHIPLLLLALALEILKQERHLLAECVQALPPRAAAVLVLVADEDFVEELVDVAEHGDVVRRRVHERCCGDVGG